MTSHMQRFKHREEVSRSAAPTYIITYRPGQSARCCIGIGSRLAAVPFGFWLHRRTRTNKVESDNFRVARAVNNRAQRSAAPHSLKLLPEKAPKPWHYHQPPKSTYQRRGLPDLNPSLNGRWSLWISRIPTSQHPSRYFCGATPGRLQTVQHVVAMVDTTMPSPDSISDGEFQTFLERYPPCLAAISASKGGTSLRGPPGLHNASF
jgi:hypothetical protein